MIKAQKIIYGIDKNHLSVQKNDFLNSFISHCQNKTTAYNNTIKVQKTTDSLATFFEYHDIQHKLLDEIAELEALHSGTIKIDIPSKQAVESFQQDLLDRVIFRSIESFCNANESYYPNIHMCVVAYLDSLKPFAERLSDENMTAVKIMVQHYIEKRDPMSLAENKDSEYAPHRSYGSVFDSTWRP